MKYYISAFHEREKVYPVEITVSERKEHEHTRLYVVVTVGECKRQKELREQKRNEVFSKMEELRMEAKRLHYEPLDEEEEEERD